tara:strand:+ start:447 stop:848 length:402 start_codon:yes stop_codon:yes gene_type:complete
MKARIKADMVTAWKAKETEKRDFLKFVIGEIERKEDATVKLTSDEIQSLLIKIDKNLVIIGDSDSMKQSVFLNPYLPTLMNEDDVKEVVNTIIMSNGYSGMKDMGKVMNDFNANFKGQADGKILSGIVRGMLN